MRRRRLVLLGALSVLLVAFLAVFRAGVAAAAGSFLVVSDRLERSDLIFLLNGDPTVRPQHAADLWRGGLAPVVLIARQADSPSVEAGAYPNPTDTNIFMLRKFGVPPDRIHELRPPGGVSHTYDEAKALLAYYNEHSFGKAIVVTSDMHSRRARFIFRRVFSKTPVKVAMAPTADLKYGAANWWTSEDGVVGFETEYLKLFYYHLKY